MPNEKTNLTYDIYDITGQKVAKGTVTGTLFDPKGFSNLIAQAVRVYKENIRQRNASTKTRGEVAGSTRKIYRQKGTGRARHGDIRAPIFIGGGTVFGPRAVEKKLKISKKMAKLAFMATVLEKIENSQFVAIDGLSELKPKTKLFNELIGKIDKNSKKILFINNGNDLLIKAARNIERVTLSGVSTVNTYDVLTHPMLIIQKESIENFFKRLDMTDEAVVKTKTDKVSKKKKTN